MKGSLKNVGTNKWRLVYDLPRGADNKRRQITSTFIGTKRDAEKFQATTAQSIANGTYLLEKGATVGSLFDRFLATFQRSWAPKTYERNSELVRVHIKPVLGTLLLERLSPIHLEEAYSNWLTSGRKDGKAGGLSPLTVLHIHRLIGQALSKGLKWQLVVRNVADNVEPPRVPYNERPVLDEVELGRLLAAARAPSKRCVEQNSIACESAFYAAVVFFAFSGARRGEGLAMRWSDIDLQTGTVVVRRSLEETRAGLAYKPPKSGRPRSLALSEFPLAVLRSHRTVQAQQRLALGPAYRNDDLIFARPDGMPYKPHTFGDAFRALVKRSGVTPIRLHDLRHTHVSLLGKAGVPLKVVSDRVGHASTAITADIYAHVFAIQDSEAANALESLVIREVGCEAEIRA